MSGRDRIAPSIAETIGNTPLVDLRRVVASSGVDGRILMKLEFLNPGYSKKDRAALRIIDEAEASGELGTGQPVLELTSGNMGTGLALVCAARGYPFIAVMSKGNTPERARMMRALGAEVVLVDQAPGGVPGKVTGDDLARVEVTATRLALDRGAFRADQFVKAGNANAHYFGTAREIWQQSGGRIDAFCDFVGSGGTFAGCARFFREQRKDIRCYVVEPEQAAVLSGTPLRCQDHPIQGGGYAMPDLALLDGIAPDGFLAVSSQQATDGARRLAREEGIFAGFSSGANLAAALALLDGPLGGATVAILACDSGLKYLTTDLWDA